MLVGHGAGARGVRPSFLVPQKLRQPRNINCDAARFVVSQHLRLQRVGLRRAVVDIGERLAVRVAHDLAAGDLLGFPRWWDTAGRGHVSSIERTAAC